MSEVEIRILDREEIDKYASDIAQVYMEAMGYSESARASLKSRIDKSASLVIAAFRSDKLLGFLFGFKFEKNNWWGKQIDSRLPNNHDFYKNTFELNELMVSPSEQGKGIGKSLMNKLHAETNYDIYLFGTQSDNLKARKLYESLGYEIIIDKFYYDGNKRENLILAKFKNG